jgi:hypothetical protein
MSSAIICATWSVGIPRRFEMVPAERRASRSSTRLQTRTDRPRVSNTMYQRRLSLLLVIDSRLNRRLNPQIKENHQWS